MKFSGREKAFLVGGACILAVLLVFHLVVYPALKRTRDLERLIPQKERDLKEIRLLKKEFESLKQARTAMAQKIPVNERTLSPLSRLDNWIERSGLRQNIRFIKPSPAAGGGGEAMTVELSMEKIDLPHLTRFLYFIQSSPGGFHIARIAIKPRYTTPRYLDVTLQMIFYRG
ncbi:MAG: type II secretion system protein M [Deltaproteobacteria bacterium]|nr:type II secretion system protein M [Deltaproteobacteria bacterium]